LNHEEHEGHEEKGMKLFIFLMFLFLTCNPRGAIFIKVHAEDTRLSLIFLLLNLRVLRELRGKKAFAL